ncbi:MAG: calcium-binding protein [Pseudomonadota bacterium]
MPYSGSGSYSVTQLGGGSVDLAAGMGATGTLTVTGGSYEIGASLTVGLAQSAASSITGLLRFDGSAASFAPIAGQAPSVLVGQGGGSGVATLGYLDLLNGATLDVTYTPGSGGSSAPGLIVGDQNGAVGQVLVSGAGSSLNVAGPSTASVFGRDSGQGTLALVGGATGTMTGLTAGDGGVGQLYLSGEGSELVLSAAYGDGTSGLVGGAIFGTSQGAGFLGIGGGADLILRPFASASQAPGVVFGADTGSYGYGIVSGIGSQLVFEDTGTDPADAPVLTIGGSGQANLVLDNGADAVINGAGARIDIGALAQGNGLLQILDGASGRLIGGHSAVLIAPVAQSTGTVRLNGTDSLLAAGALLTIAAGVVDGDTSAVSATGGGTGTLELGQGTRATATQTILGAGGEISGTGRLETALSAYGTITPGGDGVVGGLTISGSLDLDAMAEIAIDINAFASGSADQIILSGPLTGTVTADQFDLSIAPGALSGVGAITVIATAGALPSIDTTFAQSGAALRLYSQNGVGLRLEQIGLQLIGTPGADAMTGGAGDDQFVASAGADLLQGGAGSDLADFSGSTAVSVNLFANIGQGGFAEGDQFTSIENLLGGSEGDRLTGTDDANTILGGGGGDLLIGRGGDDQIDGTIDADILQGGAGNDILNSQGGNDSLFGGAGNDVLNGGAETDFLSGGSGADSLNGWAGADRLNGGAGDDTLRGGNADDQLEGGPGADVLEGEVGHDTLFGQGGLDSLFGGAGDDSLFGGAGADSLTGGEGGDQLFGGTGADQFVYASASDAPIGASAETIGDFRVGEDLIDLTAFDANPTLAGRQELSFLGAAAFTGQSGQVRSGVTADPTVGFVEIDLDGDSAADLRIELINVPGLSLSDFEL